MPLEKKEPKMVEGWITSSLNAICSKIALSKIKVKQKDYLPNGEFPIVDQGSILIGGFSNDKWLLVPDEPPYIIFGDHTKNIKYINFNFVAGADGIKVLKAKSHIEPKFLYYALTQIRIENKGYARHFQQLENSKFQIPPRNIQQAIVSKIEELFSELDKGIEQLKIAQQQLSIYRQAVLKSAFEGKLTNNLIETANLPKTWRFERLGDIAETCLGKMLDANKNKGTAMPYLGNINVRWGKFELADLKEMKIAEHELERFSVKKGDLIVCEGGEPGRCAIWKNEKTVIFQKALHRIRVNKGANAEYIYYFLRYVAISGSLSTYFTGTTIKHLTGTELKKVLVPLTEIEEQLRVVSEIENRLSVSDNIEATITQALQQSESLRQGILKMAFEGRLTETSTLESVEASVKEIPEERKVLAARIIHMFENDKNFGLTKFQKVFYLIENHAQVPYGTHYIKETAGPYDRDFTRAFRQEMQQQDWVQEEHRGNKTRLLPSDNIGKLEKEYAKHFRSKSNQILFVIEQLMSKSTHDAELIATLYAVWNNRLIQKKAVKVDNLVADFFSWSPKKITEFQEEEIISTYKWMKKIDFVPTGFGKVIESVKD